MSDKTGGPAFPFPYPAASDAAIYGISARDYFAAAALTLAAAGASHVMEPRDMTPAQVREIVAGEAYKMADAMLAERAK